MCVTSFPISLGFQDFVLHHFHSNSTNGTYAGRILAPYCYWRLTRTIKDGRGESSPPNLAKINLLLKSGLKPRQVYFGGNIHYIMKLHQNDGLSDKIPTILPKLFGMVKAFGGLETEGIFRKAPNAHDVEILKKNIETKGDYSCSKEDPHIPANVIKIWLRELDVPLIPPTLYDKCLKKTNPRKLLGHYGRSSETAKAHRG
eukprot:TRINITY_DN1423_c0_g1_i2.p1 TRINITY_DN1423_c0_g1~~TRINITY_DN1423_c0_g1_i2.p1  ORF type:complete len:201 (+),score=30.53 TRINITY_DN1423_c0_g1_i2:385-987(+)